MAFMYDAVGNQKEDKKAKIKKYSILSTSNVYECKSKPPIGAILSGVLTCASIMIVAGYYYFQWVNYNEQDNLSVIYYEAHNANYVSPVTESITEEELIEEEPEKPMVLLEGAKALLAENGDTVGYIKIDGIKVDNVVVQGDNNEFYLDHNFYGKKSQPGTLFVDYRCVINTRNDSNNLIVYGHNQKDGKMFGELDLYKWDSKFWLSHNIINFNTNYEERQYVIVASFVTNELPEHDNGNVFDYYNYILFNSYYPFDKWYSEIMERTMFKTGIECTADDEYLTLSTCSSEWEPSRHVIIARKLRDGEEIDTSGYEWISHPKYPQIYYDLYGGKWEG